MTTFNAITDLFTQQEVLDYVNNRVVEPRLGELLFPNRKVQSFEFDYLRAGSRIPVVASVHAFDTEAEMGQREGSKQAMELALIKRKIQLKETDLLALRQPRNAQEQAYLMREVYNDVEKMVLAVETRIEQMRMEVLSNGTVTVDENGLSDVIDYQVPAANKVTGAFTSGTSILDLLNTWVDLMDETPTRILTSKKVRQTMLSHPEIKALFKDLGMVPSQGNLNALLQNMGLPVIATYDAKYRKTKADGTYDTLRFLPENKLVMMTDAMPGETIFGMTPEEARITTGGNTQYAVGNIMASIYDTGYDPIGTFTKASAVAMPSFPEADNIVQATISFA